MAAPLNILRFERLHVYISAKIGLQHLIMKAYLCSNNDGKLPEPLMVIKNISKVPNQKVKKLRFVLLVLVLNKMFCL